ncbi:MAG TPA: hypothetical protein IAA53_03235 [Candidatus Avoscillospira avicola]|uniref:Uncharacterized protein n=1 Tax=Candidatus Avoscillospira avicola TaxID=2840706 RepID=A0A9D1IWM9_9FIRM|nr:hypothetical protein [Candidatus Avoscillospira avicola]
MGFLIHSVDDNRVLGLEYLPCSAITPKVGMALVQTSGNLALASGTTAPTYISMCERDTACTAGELIPVVRVQKDIIFGVPAQAAMTSVKLGDKVTIHTDGLQVTATTASGVAEVVGMDGTAAGSTVLVRF